MAAEAAEKRQIMKTYQKLVAGGLIVALSAGCTFAYAGNRADAAEKELPVVGVNREAGIAVTKTQSGLEAEKKELVYVFADANGEKKQVVVTDTLTNPDGLKSLSLIHKPAGYRKYKGRRELCAERQQPDLAG